MNNLLKDFKIQPTKLRGENMSICEASITNPKKQLEFYKQLSEQLQQENKQLKGSLQTYEVLVKSNVDAIKNKNILDELEKWLIDIKEGIEELTISFQECGHSAKPSIVINDVLNKLQELKGESNEK